MGTNAISAIKMSKKNVDFSKRNPVIAQKAGVAVLMLNQLQEMVNLYKEMLNSPGLFSTMLENGTEEEVVDFLKEIGSVTEGEDMRTITGLDKEEFDFISNKATEYGAVVVNAKKTEN